MNFVRRSNDWEVDLAMSFFSLLHSHIPMNGGADQLKWSLSW